MTTSVGIDYGLGRTNRNPETGIRFGVIPAHAVPCWDEWSEPEYNGPTCPYCGGSVVEYDPDEHRTTEDYKEEGLEVGLDEPTYTGDRGCNGFRKFIEHACEHCHALLESEECYGDQPDYFGYDDYGYELRQGGDDPDLWVMKSPYFTYAQFCSPCAPGACYLLNPLFEPVEGNKCYCLGRDWFEHDAAPYPIWEVATGELIYVPEGFFEEIE